MTKCSARRPWRVCLYEQLLKWQLASCVLCLIGGGGIDSRFNSDAMVLPEDATFEQIRAAMDLVVAGLLVAVGTSLADRAWSRESAVFRTTGVLSVIGGWFITAGVTFIALSRHQ